MFWAVIRRVRVLFNSEAPRAQPVDELILLIGPGKVEAGGPGEAWTLRPVTPGAQTQTYVRTHTHTYKN